MAKRLKLFQVEFHYSNKVKGTVMASSRSDAIKKIKTGENAVFNDLRTYDQPAELEIEIEAVYDEDFIGD